MRIREFFKQHFRQRLEQSACLVCYDPEGRYREIVDDLGQDYCRVIDAGANRPKLRGLLKAGSSSEILTALLSPSETQHQALEQDEAWPAELKQFAKSILGLKLNTITRFLNPLP